MLAHPVRNDPVTLWSLPLNCHHNINNTANPDNFIHIQDDQLPPDLLHHQQSLFHEQLPLESPFQSPAHLHHFSSPPSSASSSPIFSSPSFSSARSPATAVSSDFPAVLDGGFYEAPSMSATSSFNPSIHIQPPQFQTGSPMLAQHGISSNNHGWDSDGNIQLLSPARAQNGLARRSGFQNGAHKRASSGSSGTADSTSPHAATFNHQRNTSSFSPNGFADNYQNSQKGLPTPVQTPVQNSFLAAPFQNYDPSAHNGDNVEAERAMRQAVMEQQHHQLPHQAATEEDTSFQYSLAPSASSLSHHNSPVTPQTTYDDFDEGSKALFRGEDRSPGFERWMDEYLQLDARSDVNGQGAATVGLPKLNRTISDIYQDELYNATVIPAPQVRKPNQPQAQPILTPYRNLFADRLQAANQGHLSARSQSPANHTISRERSPFRQGSPLAVDFRTARLPQSSLSATMQLPHTNGIDLGNQQDNPGEPKTISPKDALLEYHEGPEDASMPSLFPSNQSAPEYHVNSGGDNLGFRRPSASAFQPTQNYNPMESFPDQYTHQAAGLQQPFSFLQQQQPQHPRRQPQHHHANNLIQQTPDFPASLPTMESTASETAPPVQQTTHEVVRRPDDTSSDSGTYTCTYHGCTLRFETPAKLQKHKREAHRQTTMAGHLAGRDVQGNTTAMRNSQAGPHKCERINPSTGKPCNSIFSRPYDLTRHEDTIHNARKQKVRCHLCTEEKTFSRNDALTRHMRVVHPDVDWPGKQRRKGRD